MKHLNTYRETDAPSLAADPPPVHPSGLVVGKRRAAPSSVSWALDRHRGDRARRTHDARRSESGSTTLAAATAFWTVAGLLGLLAGFLHLAGRCAA